MENRKTKFPIAAVFFAIICLFTIQDIYKYGYTLANNDVSASVYVVAFSFAQMISELIVGVCICICLIKKKSGKQLFFAITVLSILESTRLIDWFIGFCYGFFDLILLLYTLIALFDTILAIILAFIVGVININKFNKYQGKEKKIFSLLIGTFIIKIICEITLAGIYGFANFEMFIEPILQIFAYLLLANWCIDPFVKEKIIEANIELGDNTKNQTNMILDYNESYYDLVKHILLSLFTCGVWMYMWIYKTTKALNKTPNSEKYDPMNKLLLCLFVPFYMVYWFYKHGEKVDKLNKYANIKKEDNATMYLLLAIFIPVVACILMQDNINKLCTVDKVDKAVNSISSGITMNEENNAEAIKKYKDLLDTGVITQEEFDAKKKQLLNL